MIKFREKEFSVKDDMIAGLMIGGLTGVAGKALRRSANALAGSEVISSSSRAGKILDSQVASSVSGAILGAALGGLYYLFSKSLNSSATRNNRKVNLPREISDILVKSGYKREIDFTFDPKVANNMKTAVCIVISRSSDEMSLLINTINDSKLDTISSQILKNLPNTSVITRRKSDKWNELYISSMSSNNWDSGFIASIAEKFIQRKYPVYIVEVG